MFIQERREAEKKRALIEITGEIGGLNVYNMSKSQTRQLKQDSR